MRSKSVEDSCKEVSHNPGTWFLCDDAAVSCTEPFHTIIMCCAVSPRSKTLARAP